MVCHNGYKIPTFDRLITPVEPGGRTINTPPSIVADNKRANILVRNFLPQLGIHLQQERPNGKSINFMAVTDQSDAVITNWVKSTYPGLCTRIGHSKNHMVHTKLLSDFATLQKKDAEFRYIFRKKLKKKSDPYSTKVILGILIAVATNNS